MKQVIYLLIGLYCIAAAGCHATKKISTVIPKIDSVKTVKDNSREDSLRFIQTTLGGIEKNRIDYKTFSGKIKVDYWDKDGKGPDLTVFVRIQKDSIIWLSINATVFSYEAFRVMITPDSVKLINKKDKIVQFKSVKYLEEMAKLPFDFNIFQNMIVGNPVFLDSNIVSYKQQANTVSLLCVGEMFKNLITVNSDTYLLQHIKLDDVNLAQNRTCDLSYSNYNGSAGVPFATFRRITLAEKGKLDVQMEFKQFSFNESLNFPFAIPKNYTVQ
jgi:outer membrane lipoprotein-sorting protein